MIPCHKRNLISSSSRLWLLFLSLCNVRGSALRGIIIAFLECCKISVNVVLSKNKKKKNDYTCVARNSSRRARSNSPKQFPMKAKAYIHLARGIEFCTLTYSCCATSKPFAIAPAVFVKRIQPSPVTFSKLSK